MFTKIEQIKNLLDELSTELDALRSRFTGFGNVVKVDGREWFVLQPNASARIVSENCIAFKGPLNVAYVKWPEGTKAPPGNVTRMLPEHPQVITFTLADGSYVVFTGNCRLVSGGAALLQATSTEEIFVWFVNDLSEATNAAALEMARKYPFKLNWQDRRPIGKSFPYGASGTPRNWLWKWSNQEEFEAGYHAHIDACIDNCKSVDAQGLIVWALEGEPFGHPISYIADPEHASKYSPEVTQDLCRALFRKITDAGLRAGVTIRPTQIRPVEWNVFKYWQFTLANNYEYYNELNRKIKWAHDELGCTLFYMDSMIRVNDTQSPIPPGTTQLLPFETFARLCDAWPDCLLIPEQLTPAMYSKCAAFGSQVSPIDPVIKAAYPQAFCFMHGQSASYARDTELLRSAMAEGNIGTFNAWYPSPEINALLTIKGT